LATAIYTYLELGAPAPESAARVEDATALLNPLDVDLLAGDLPDDIDRAGVGADEDEIRLAAGDDHDDAGTSGPSMAPSDR
jgi:hypothetical protein